MAFTIHAQGPLHHTVRRRLVDVVGKDALEDIGGHVVIRMGDQAAMIGCLHHLNDLALNIICVEHTSP